MVMTSGDSSPYSSRSSFTATADVRSPLFKEDGTRNNRSSRPPSRARPENEPLLDSSEEGFYFDDTRTPPRGSEETSMHGHEETKSKGYLTLLTLSIGG